MDRKYSYIAGSCLGVFVSAAIAGYAFVSSSERPTRTPLPAPPPENQAKVDPLAPWPMFGGTPSRNMVNLHDKNIPVTWNAEDGKFKNIKWTAQLGDHCYTTPVIADGKIFVGTNNHRPRDPKIKGQRAVLMALNEADGKFLWQITHDIPDHVVDEARPSGLCSTPVYENKQLYYVTPGCELVCAGADGKIVWTLDMYKDLKVVPFHLANCSPLIVGDLVMVVTSNGTDTEGKVVAPKAPSFIAVNKKTGKLAWQSALPGDKIFEGQWSNPSVAVVNGKTQVIFAGGDCVIYGLEPTTGDLIWKCNCAPIRKTKADREMDPYIISTPVVADGKLYVALGVFPTHAQTPRSSHFLCLDVTKKGDVSPKSLNAKDPANKGSALIWAVGGLIDPPPPRGRAANFGNSFSTAAVHGGLAYITEETGILHCFDANTGQRYWEHDFKDSVWSSPYYVDGKIYVGTQGGSVVIFLHGKECKYYVDGQPLAASRENEKKLSDADLGLGDTEAGTAVVANGVLYFTTKTRLIAIANGK